MNAINQFIEVIDDLNDLNEKIKPLSEERDVKNAMLRSLNDGINNFSPLHNFLAKKILETYSEKDMELVSKYREYIRDISNSSRTYYDSTFEKVFDPMYDDWYIFNYERNKDTDEIRFSVSCKKNEGSISGLLTFLDVHNTNWFKISEFNEENNLIV